MRRWSVVLVLALLVWFAGGWGGALAQDGNPALMKKLQAAYEEEDSPAKLQEVLRILKTDAPTGSDGRLTRRLYRQTLFSLYSTEAQRKQILTGLQAMVDATPAGDRDDATLEAAQSLQQVHLLPEDAQTLAAQALQMNDATQEAQRKQWKQMQASTRSYYLSTLGQTYLTNGQKVKAKDLLEQAFEVDPLNDGTAAGLAELSDGAGDPAGALRYLVPDILSGTANDRVKKDFSSMYARAHGNSTAGMDEMLDEAYVSSSASLVPVTKYAAVRAGNPHRTLVELFASSSCATCRAADLAVDAEQRRYAGGEALLLVYHENLPAADPVEAPDPMSNVETEARGAFYGVQVRPAVYVDGAELETMSGDRDDAAATFAKLQEAIDRELDRETTAALTIKGAMVGGKVTGEVMVSGMSEAEGNYVVQIALVEDGVHYAGSNGVRLHPMVVRDLANGGKGYVYKGTPAETIAFRFDLPEREEALRTYLKGVEAQAEQPFRFDRELLPMDRAHVALVAFVQEMKSKEIVQAAVLPLHEASLRALAGQR